MDVWIHIKNPFIRANKHFSVFKKCYYVCLLVIKEHVWGILNEKHFIFKDISLKFYILCLFIVDLSYLKENHYFKLCLS